MDTITAQIELDEKSELGLISGGFEGAMRLIGEALEVVVSSRGSRIFLQGPPDQVRQAEGMIEDLRHLSREGRMPTPGELKEALRAVQRGEKVSLKKLFSCAVHVSPKKRPVLPRSDNQRLYIEAIREHDMTIGIGPAGTGKTYLAMAMAVSALIHKEVSRIVLARPAVEAGERLGYLPGDMYEKVNPYLRPLYDALFDMMEADRVSSLMERGIIEIAPLAFMRGRTLNDSFIILDEAQNTTSEQMKMYLTRLGYNSKTVITGDITQIDLPSAKVSGLVEAEKLLGSIGGIKVINFTDCDVVRHRLVQEIVKAYERYEKRTAKDNGQEPQGL